MIRTIYFKEQSVVILDQNQLPDRVVYEVCHTPEEVAEAIRCLKIRGAPLIGVAAAFGIALAMLKFSGKVSEMKAYYAENRRLLAATRPTAINLFWALNRMDSVYQDNAGRSPAEIGRLLLEEAQAIFTEDVEINEAIGQYGHQLLNQGSQVMTICNAGALATCGYGTALGVIRAAARQGKIERVWACETRPVLQGARLTVWELMQDSIPVTLITDNMAGYTMKVHDIDAIIVGADRIAINGDTANKIGTYSLAVMAQYHGIPFYVAAPLSTIDLSISSGDEIPIEERHADEVRRIRGINLTVPEVQVFNPAFDVTPRELIRGIITEKGLLEPPYPKSIVETTQRGSV